MKENNKKQRNTAFLSFCLNNKALFLVLIVSIIAVCFSPKFLLPSNLINVLRQVCASAIIGIGYTFVMASGNMDLSVGSMVGLVGVVMASVSKINGMPFAVAILIGMLTGVLCSVLNGTISVLFTLPTFIVTLAMSNVYKGVCYLLCNNTPVSGLPTAFKFIGQSYIAGIPVPVYILAIVAIVYSIILYRSKLGRHLIAIGGNVEASRVCGVEVNKVKIATYAMMGLCVSVAAMILTGRAFSAQPNAGQGMEMDAIAAVVIGGTAFRGGNGKVFGTILGCLLVGIINNMLNLAAVNSNWQLITKGLLIVFAVVLDSQSARIVSYINKSLTKNKLNQENDSSKNLEHSA